MLASVFDYNYVIITEIAVPWFLVLLICQTFTVSSYFFFCVSYFIDSLTLSMTGWFLIFCISFVNQSLFESYSLL